MLITPIAVGITWRIMMMPDLGVLNYLAENCPEFQPTIFTGISAGSINACDTFSGNP